VHGLLGLLTGLALPRKLFLLLLASCSGALLCGLGCGWQARPPPPPQKTCTKLYGTFRIASVSPG
jgi:hypothetical protein